MSDRLIEVFVLAKTAAAQGRPTIEVSLSSAFSEPLQLVGSQYQVKSAEICGNPAEMNVDLSDVSADDVLLQVAYDAGTDYWIPSAVYVIGRAESGRSALIAAVPDWPDSIRLTANGADGSHAVSPGDYAVISLGALLEAL